MNIRLTGCAAAALVSASFSQIQAEDCLGQKIRVQKEQYYIDQSGLPASRLVDAAGTNNRGDELVYTILITNRCSAPVAKAQIDIPIPDHTVYTKTTAKGDNTDRQFSVDGAHYDRWDSLKIKGADGVLHPIEPADVKLIRWVFKQPLAPNATSLLHFHVVAN
jgi:uncharacterized repeat protein (TIGR01451 family)